MSEPTTTPKQHGGARTGAGRPTKNDSLPLPDVAEAPELTALVDEFNKTFYVVGNFGSKCHVCWEGQNPYFNEAEKGAYIELHHQSFYDFQNRFLGDPVIVGVHKKTGEPITMNKGEAWLNNPRRRKYDEVVFFPGKDVPANVHNLWTKFAFEPVKGDCLLYLAHVKDNICNGDPIKYRYLTCWMAYAVRNPSEQGHVAIVVNGLKGVGKNVFAEAFAALWGQHATSVSDEHGVTGNFNVHLRDKVVLIADEALFAGDPRQDRVLKSLITGETMQVEPKGVDKTTVRNYLHVIVIGNDDRLVNATYDERRYFVMRCGDQHRNDFDYFAAIQDQLKHGGYAALLYHLMHEVDLTGFEVRKVPTTKELLDYISLGLSGVESAWYDCLVTGELPAKFVDKHSGKAKLSAPDFVTWATRHKDRFSKAIPARAAGILFHALKCVRDTEGTHRYWIIPPLAEARGRWDEWKVKGEWPEADGWVQIDD